MRSLGWGWAVQVVVVSPDVSNSLSLPRSPQRDSTIVSPRNQGHAAPFAMSTWRVGANPWIVMEYFQFAELRFPKLLGPTCSTTVRSESSTQLSESSGKSINVRDGKGFPYQKNEKRKLLSIYSQMVLDHFNAVFHPSMCNIPMFSEPSKNPKFQVGLIKSLTSVCFGSA